MNKIIPFFSLLACLIYTNVFAYTSTVGIIKSDENSAEWSLQLPTFHGVFSKTIKIGNQLFFFGKEDDDTNDHQIILKSTDHGATVEDVSAQFPKNVVSIAGNNTVLVTAEQKAIQYSLDQGKTWTFATLPAEFVNAQNVNLHGIAANGNNFIAVGSYIPAGKYRAFAVILISADQGKTWNFSSFPNDKVSYDQSEFFCAQWINNQWVIGGILTGKDVILTSPDGSNWTEIYPGFYSYRIISVAFHHNEWYAIETNPYYTLMLYRTIHSIDNGKTWNRVNDEAFSPLMQRIKNITFNGTIWTALGIRYLSDMNITRIPTVLTSTDGRSWVTHAMPLAFNKETSTINDIVWDDAHWIALGSYFKADTPCEMASARWTGYLQGIHVQDLWMSVNKSYLHPGAYDVNASFDYYSGALHATYGLQGTCIEGKDQVTINVSSDSTPESLTITKANNDNSIQIIKSNIDIGGFGPNKIYAEYLGTLGRKGA